MVELFPDYWFDRLVDTTVPALMSLGMFETDSWRLLGCMQSVFRESLLRAD